MTVKELQRERLRKYLEAETAILINQSYVIGSRQYTRADLEEVRKVIQSLIDSGVTLDDDDKFSGNGMARAIFID